VGDMNIVVLGFHRSGTSLMGSILDKIGFFYADKINKLGPAADNPEGFYENKQILNLNDKILSLYKSDWNNPLGIYKSQEIKNSSKINFEIKKTIDYLNHHQIWFIKDPRMCLTFAHWKKYIQDPIIINVERNEVEICQSLSTRNNFEFFKSLSLIHIYKSSTLQILKSQKKIIQINYNDLILNPLKELTKFFNSLKDVGLKVGLDEDKQIENLSELINLKLYRSKLDQKLVPYKNFVENFFINSKLEKSKLIENNDIIAENYLILDSEIRNLRLEITKLENQILQIKNSNSWKITKPLRRFKDLLNKK